MPSDFSLYATPPGGARRELTDLVRTLTWSGDYKTVARQLSLSLLQTARDAHQPQLSLPAGTVLELALEDETVFGGTVLEDGDDSLGSDVDLTAKDWAVYLKRNSDYIKVERETPEAVTARLASALGFEAGRVAVTGVPVSHNFLPGDYWTVITTLYALAGTATGKKYRPRFRGQVLDVVELVQTEESLLLRPGSNLLSVRRRHSTASLVNRVRILDDQLHERSVAGDPTSQALYGLFSQAIMAKDHDDPEAKAAELLRDGAMSTTLICDCIGDRRLITGNTVIVNEPITDTNGLFYITADTNTWTRGLWETKLELSLRDLVSEAAAAEAAKLTKKNKT